MKNYVATYIDKIASVDCRDTGVDPKSAVCVMAESINISADSMPHLLEKLSRMYGADQWFHSDTDGFVSFNQHENAYGVPMTFQMCVDYWKSGKTVFLCDYTFRIVIRDEEYVSCEEIAKAIEYVSSETAVLTEEK